MTHSTSTNTPLAAWRAEIVGCRKAISEIAGIPMDEIAGFRAPYLKYDNESFSVLHEQGFGYDASLIEIPGALSPNGRSLIWPYALDRGVPQVCWTGTRPRDAFPGLFEIPLWKLLDANDKPYSTMDPPGSYAQLSALFHNNFTNRYEGNRAPLGLYLQAEWVPTTINGSNKPTAQAHGAILPELLLQR